MEVKRAKMKFLSKWQRGDQCHAWSATFEPFDHQPPPALVFFSFLIVVVAEEIYLYVSIEVSCAFIPANEVQCPVTCVFICVLSQEPPKMQPIPNRMGLGLRPPLPSYGQGPSMSALAQQQQMMHFVPPQQQKQTNLFVGSISGGITDDYLNQLLSVSGSVVHLS